jgi:hypothetical protein
MFPALLPIVQSLSVLNPFPRHKPAVAGRFISNETLGHGHRTPSAAEVQVAAEPVVAVLLSLPGWPDSPLLSKEFPP